MLAHVIVIVIGGLKSMGLTKHLLCYTVKTSPLEILTIHRLLMLRDVQKSLVAYPNDIQAL
jgi:hypothetical protein